MLGVFESIPPRDEVAQTLFTTLGDAALNRQVAELNRLIALERPV